jgi:hypothetical protein
MKALAIIVSSVLAASLFAANKATFDIDAEMLLEVFLAAVAEQLPDIPQQDLRLEHGITVLCFSTDPGERAARNEQFRPCVANIEFGLGSNPATSRYRDREGDCKIHRGIEVVSASLSSDGYIKVGSRVNPSNPETVLACEQDAAVPPDRSPIHPHELRFSVDAHQILTLSLAAVSQTFPDIPPQSLFLNSVIYLWCNPDSRNKGLPGLHAKLEPCFAKVPFTNWSDITEWREVDSNGNCTITTRIGNVKVVIMQNGNVRVNDDGWGETDPQVVECTEKFYESLDSRT